MTPLTMMYGDAAAVCATMVMTLLMKRRNASNRSKER